jgi:hypothetical protein
LKTNFLLRIWLKWIIMTQWLGNVLWPNGWGMSYDPTVGECLMTQRLGSVFWPNGWESLDLTVGESVMTQRLGKSWPNGWGKSYDLTVGKVLWPNGWGKSYDPTVGKVLWPNGWGKSYDPTVGKCSSKGPSMWNNHAYFFVSSTIKHQMYFPVVPLQSRNHYWNVALCMCLMCVATSLLWFLVNMVLLSNNIFWTKLIMCNDDISLLLFCLSWCYELITKCTYAIILMFSLTVNCVCTGKLCQTFPS